MAMPLPGEHAMIAIANYGGYSQEDSLIFNKDSIQKGKFRVRSLKKYMEEAEERLLNKVLEMNKFNIKDTDIIEI
jgi:DNA-directed RNA polymerase beta subunit